jgi:hypothetical protein
MASHTDNCVHRTCPHPFLLRWSLSPLTSCPEAGPHFLLISFDLQRWQPYHFSRPSALPSFLQSLSSSSATLTHTRFQHSLHLFKLTRMMNGASEQSERVQSWYRALLDLARRTTFLRPHGLVVETKSWWGRKPLRKEHRRRPRPFSRQAKHFRNGHPLLSCFLLSLSRSQARLVPRRRTLAYQQERSRPKVPLLLSLSPRLHRQSNLSRTSPLPSSRLSRYLTMPNRAEKSRSRPNLCQCTCLHQVSQRCFLSHHTTTKDPAYNQWPQA